MKKIMMSLIATGALVSSAYAGCTANGCFDVEVETIYITGSGTIHIGTSGDESALDCTSPGNHYAVLGNTDAGKNSMYSALLTAKTTKQKVSIRIVNGSGNCKIAYIGM